MGHFLSRDRGMDTADFAARVKAGRGYYLRLARQYMRNVHDAEDVVGDAVCAGLSKLHELRSDACFSAWMREIVIHCAASRLRNQLQEGSLQALPAGAYCPMAGAADWEQFHLRMDLERALRARSPWEQRCIWMHSAYGLTFWEMAEYFELPEGMVKSRWYRALRCIRKDYGTMRPVP